MNTERNSAENTPPPQSGMDQAPVETVSERHRGMPPWVPRVILFVFIAASVFLLATWAFQRLQGLIVTLLVSLFLALAIEPAVNVLAKRGLRRGIATVLVFFVLFIVIAGFFVALGRLFLTEVNAIAEHLPDYVDGVIGWVNDTFNTHLSSADLQSGLAIDSETLGRYGTQVATNVLGLGASVFAFVFRLFTILLFTYYLSAEGPSFRRHVVSLFPPAQQGEVLRAWEIAIDKTGGYIYSRALMAIVSFVAHYILLLVLDIPNALALAIWVGVVSQFIPTVGTYLAGAVPIIVALAEDPIDALWIFLFILVYQQFENYILQPKITSKTVQIHPALAFGAVIAGASLLGPIGAFIAIPIAASASAFLSTYVRRYEVTDPAIAVDSKPTGSGASGGPSTATKPAGG
jgi:predicted PurR-regulated permease PerM